MPILPFDAAEVPDTRRFKGRGERIDHIFASDRLLNPHQMSSARAVAATELLPSICETSLDRNQNFASDHAAVVAFFHLNMAQ